MRTILAGLLGLAAAAAIAAPSARTAMIGATAPAPVTVLAAADAHVLKSSPGANTGSARALKVQGPDRAVAYLLFTVSGLASAPASASLQLFATAAGPGFSVHVANSSSWGEKTITYRNQPGYATASLASSGALTAGRWTTLDLSSLVRGNGTYSLALVGAGTKANTLASREAGSARAPRLLLAASAGAGAPQNSSPPTVSGTAEVGSTLSAGPGVWSGATPMSYAYQWQACDAAGAGCTDIAGATGQSLSLSSSLSGETLRVVVSATNAAGSAAAASAATSAVSAGAQAPQVASSPTISGTARQGQTLAATAGSWQGTAPIAYAYQWRACDPAGACADIAGATASSLLLAAGQVGDTVLVSVSARNAAGSATASSAPTAAVAGFEAPASQSPPSVSGTAQVGASLTADPGAWSGTPAPVLSYQWQRCDASGAGCADIAGAAGQSYAVVSADAGASLRVAVSAANDAGSQTAYSPATAPVAAAALPASVLFGGNAPVGQSHEASVQALESKAGRKLAIVRVYERWDQAFPTSDDLWLASSGHPVVLSVKARRLDGSYLSFADIAAATPGSGSPLYDDIVAWADAVKQFPERVWFTFNPEPEGAGSQASGGAADYVAAWQNVVSIFRAQGVSSVDYLWNVTAYGLGTGGSDAYYPGDAWVDDIGADGYNSAGCKAGGWRSFDSVFAGLRSFAAAHPGEGVIIPEWGSTEDPAQPGRKAQWLADMEQTLETPAWSRLTAALVWSSTIAGTSGTCDYRVDSSQSALDAWRAMGQDSYFQKFAG